MFRNHAGGVSDHVDSAVPHLSDSGEVTSSPHSHSVGGGVLLRALQTLERIDLLQRSGAATRLTDLDWICTAMVHFGSRWQRIAGAIGKSVRIGRTRNVDRRWRFYERVNPYVSGPKSYPSSSAAPDRSRR